MYSFFERHNAISFTSRKHFAAGIIYLMISHGRYDQISNLLRNIKIDVSCDSDEFGLIDKVFSEIRGDSVKSEVTLPDFLSKSPKDTNFVQISPEADDVSIIKSRFIYYKNYNKKGDTYFHFLIKSGSPLHKFLIVIEHLGNKYSSKLARTINDRGELPLDLIQRERFFDADEENIITLLKMLTYSNPLKNPHINIDRSKILKKYSYVNQEKLNNLMYACRIVNITRNEHILSSTHPSFQDYSSKKQNKIIKLIRLIRYKEIDLDEFLKILLPNILEPHNSAINLRAERALKKGVGNCSEIACISYKKLKEIAPDIPAEICSITNGDHAFLVIGEGKDKVICDAWARKVFLYDESVNKLSNYRNDVITSYNPKFHSINPIKFDSLHEWVLCKINSLVSAWRPNMFFFFIFLLAFTSGLIGSTKPSEIASP